MLASLARGMSVHALSVLKSPQCNPQVAAAAATVNLIGSDQRVRHDVSQKRDNDTLRRLRAFPEDKSCIQGRGLRQTGVRIAGELWPKVLDGGAPVLLAPRASKTPSPWSDISSLFSFAAYALLQRACNWHCTDCIHGD